MSRLLDERPEASFLCDETPVGGQNGIQSEFLVEFSKRVKDDSFFWIACNHKWPDKTALEPGRNFLFVIASK